MKNFSEVISKLLIRHGLSQKTLAERSGLEPHHISQLVSPKKRKHPYFETLEKIALACGESVVIFSDEEPPAQGAAYPSEVQKYIEPLVEILQSNDEESAAALKANIMAFHSSLKAKRKADEALNRVAELERLLGISPKDKKGEPKPPKTPRSSGL